MRVLKVIAIVVLFWGVIRLSMGLYVATVFEGSQSATARYLGSGTSGEAIDQGIYRIIFAVLLLIIVRLVRKKLSH
jgi:hypothetical protein